MSDHSGAFSYLYAPGVRQSWMHVFSAPTTKAHGTVNYYLGVYIALAVTSSILGTVRYMYVYFGSIRASRTLFAKLNFTILHTPTRWLDTVPVGRILNRYTSDFTTIDTQLAYSVCFGANQFLNLMRVVVSGFFVSTYIVLLASVLLLICLYFAVRYLDGARPVKRLESTTKSPVFEQFGSALTGVTTIRGFGKSQVYIERMYRRIDDFSAATWHLWLFNRWMGWRMALVGSFFSSIVSIMIVLMPGIDSALAGFTLAFALEFANAVMWTIRFYANIELNMNSAERIIEVRIFKQKLVREAKAGADLITSTPNCRQKTLVAGARRLHGLRPAGSKCTTWWSPTLLTCHLSSRVSHSASTATRELVSLVAPVPASHH
jgi:ABC-type multidrug transport system fused ATPase/permease subunit